MAPPVPMAARRALLLAAALLCLLASPGAAQQMDPELYKLMTRAIRACGSDVVQEFTTSIARAQAIAVGDGSVATAEAEQEPPFVKCAQDWTDDPGTCPEVCQGVTAQWGETCAKRLMLTLGYVWEQLISGLPSPSELIEACGW